MRQRFCRRAHAHEPHPHLARTLDCRARARAPPRPRPRNGPSTRSHPRPLAAHLTGASATRPGAQARPSVSARRTLQSRNTRRRNTRRHNTRRHNGQLLTPKRYARRWLDARCSSVPHFPGFVQGDDKQPVRARELGAGSLVVRPRTWLLGVGWRRLGPIPSDHDHGPSTRTSHALASTPLAAHLTSAAATRPTHKPDLAYLRVERLGRAYFRAHFWQGLR